MYFVRGEWVCNFRLFCAWASFFLFLLSWLWPFHSPPWPSFWSEIFAVLALSFLAMGLRRGYWGYETLFVFLVALVPVMQFFFGLVLRGSDAFLSSVYVLVFCLAFSVGAGCSGLRGELVKYFSFCVVLSALLSAGIAIRQWLGLVGGGDFELGLVGLRSYANLGQPNHLATLLMMGLCGCLYLHLCGHLARGVGAVAVFLLLFALVLTQSRTPWLSGFAVVVFFVISRSERASEFGFRGALLSYLLYWLLVVSLPFLSSLTDVSVVDPVARASADARFDLWRQMFQILKENWLFGVGWGQIGISQVAISFSFPMGGWAEYSHNVVLDLLLWNGVCFGGLVVLVCFIWVVRLGLKEHDAEGVVAILMVGVILTHGMLEFPLAYLYFLIPLGLSLGVAVAPYVSNCLVGSRIVLGGALILLGGVIFVGWEYLKVEQEELARRVSAAGVVGFESVYEKDELFFLSGLSEVQSFKRIDPGQNFTSEERVRLWGVVERYPQLSNIYRYAVIARSNGDSEGATKALALIKVFYGEANYWSAMEELGCYY